MTILRSIKEWLAYKRLMFILWRNSVTCWNCGVSFTLKDSDRWARGENVTLRQAFGERGKRCSECGFIHWESFYPGKEKKVNGVTLVYYAPGRKQYVYDYARLKNPRIDRYCYDRHKEMRRQLKRKR